MDTKVKLFNIHHWPSGTAHSRRIPSPVAGHTNGCVCPLMTSNLFSTHEHSSGPLTRRCIHSSRNLHRHKLRPVRAILLGLGSKHPTQARDHHFTQSGKELLGIFPETEFLGGRKGRRVGTGKIAGRAVGRGYRKMLIVNGNVKMQS